MRGFVIARCWLGCSLLGVVVLGLGLPASSWSEQAISGLPGIVKDATSAVREQYPDALLVKIRIEHQQRTQDSSERVSLYFLSPPGRLLIHIPGRPTAQLEERLLGETEERLVGIPVPEFSVDLPEAVRKAKDAGMPGELATGELSVKIPTGRLPVLVYALRSSTAATPYFVDALTGASLKVQQVVGPVASVDPELQASEDALREALRRYTQRSPSDASLWLEYVVKPILDANNIFECNALGGAWTLLRMCMP